MVRCWRGLIFALLLAATGLGVTPSFADPGGGILAENQADGAIVRGIQKAELAKFAQMQPGSATAGEGPFYEFASIAYCPGAAVGLTGFDDFCKQATLFCTGNTVGTGLGPAVEIMRREVDAAGAPVPGATWTSVGITCFPELVPGSAPTLTMAMVLEQFHRTNFALPDVSIQPVGNRTLVNLPTYYQVNWAAGGFAPQSIDTSTIIGRQVEIRPTFQWVEYHYGDGTSSGREQSLGGPYPTGNIRHTYTAIGDRQVQATVSYGGEFRVDGGAWIPIPDTVEIQGTPQALTVLEARARLVR